MDDETKEKLAKVMDKVTELDADMSLTSKGYGKVEWSIGIHFGEETPGSAMVAGASYGIGDTLSEALDGPISDFKL